MLWIIPSTMTIFYNNHTDHWAISFVGIENTLGQWATYCFIIPKSPPFRRGKLRRGRLLLTGGHAATARPRGAWRVLQEDAGALLRVHRGGPQEETFGHADFAGAGGQLAPSSKVEEAVRFEHIVYLSWFVVIHVHSKRIPPAFCKLTLIVLSFDWQSGGEFILMFNVLFVLDVNLK